MSTLISLCFSRKVLLPVKPTVKQKATQIDEEISRVIEKAHERVRGILSAHRNVLDELAHLLSQEEIVQGEETQKDAGQNPCGDFTGATGIVKVNQPDGPAYRSSSGEGSDRRRTA